MMSASNHSETPDLLRDDAISIWKAGVAAVLPECLIREQVTLESHARAIVVPRAPQQEIHIPLASQARVVVFGAGKAGAAMALALERTLLDSGLSADSITGWLNVPEGFTQQPQCIHLHPARPLGMNEPTARAVEGTRRMLEIVASMDAQDVGICLISGGGSALLCDPVEGVSLADKIETTRQLSAAGASIRELNCVRTHLSRVKGGGLCRAFNGAALLTLIISDVLGDPVETIASGPTVPQPRDSAEALTLLRKFDPDLKHFPPAVIQYLRQPSTEPPPATDTPCYTHLLGNNDRATAAACRRAADLGYEVERLSVDPSEGSADASGIALARAVDRLLSSGGRRGLISGGEPVVRLAPASRRGLGGRNQQLVLAAGLERLRLASPRESAGRFVILSGGTDGEDGPTDAAGAWITDDMTQRLHGERTRLESFLERNDAYHFFEAERGLLMTGPTHTNVCDVRVVLTDDSEVEKAG